MPLLRLPVALLAFFGRHGAIAFLLSLVLAFAVPWLAPAAKFILPGIIFCFVAINTMRADLPALRDLARDPGRIALAVALNILLGYAAIAALVAAVGREAFDPGLLLGLAIAAAAPPLVAAPAYALVLGFSNALPLAVLVLAMTLSPLVAPLIADSVAGAAVPIDRLALAGRLAVFLFGAMAAGLAARRLLGGAFVARRRYELDGVGIVLFFIFAIAITGAVSSALVSAPLRVAGYLALAFGLSAVIFALALLIWRLIYRGAIGDSVTLGLATGLRNTGLLISVMGVGAIPETTFLFFAVMQFPIYFAPQILKPLLPLLARRRPEIAGRE